MYERVSVDLTGGRWTLLGAVFRYDVMQRLAKAAAERQVTVLAFGFGESDLRLVLRGESPQIATLLSALKLGTVRAATRWGLTLRSGGHERQETDDVFDAACWAHRAPVDAGALDPLASPWSSHRDVLGFREAPFYDPVPLRELIDVRRLNRACGGRKLPAGWPPPKGVDDLSLLLRVAGAVLGVLPGDRRCFRLFVHLARARGFSNRTVAEALDVTDRRVRQLAADGEPNLDMALVVLGSPLLSRVP